MEGHHRTHLVNQLMDEANLRMSVLEKAMEGERHEQSHPALHGTPHPRGAYRLEDEHKAWGTVLRALTEIQTALEQITHAEQHRMARSRDSREA
jgi:hypothetical protein